MKRHTKRIINKNFLLTLIISVSTSIVIGQTYNNPGGTFTTCSGTFYDSGGSGSNYSNGETIITTFCSGSTDCIELDFTSFNTESGYDELTIYDGPNTASGIFGTYSGTTSPGTITSSSGCITLEFTSDGSLNRPGWEASISCVTTCGTPAPSPPTPPANDDCIGAFPITVNPDFNCTSTTAGTVEAATPSSQSDTDCFGTENDDVWFSFVATSTQHEIQLLNITGSTTDMYHSIWESTCPTLTLVAGTCSDPNSQTVAGLTIGNTYYIRVNTWSSASGATSSFDVCITTPTPPTPPGANSTCAAPDPICSGSAINFTSTVTGLDAEDDLNPGNNYGCLYSSPDPTWYYLEIDNGGDLVIDMSAGSDIDYAIWGPFPSLANAVANCNSYGTPSDCSYSIAATEQASITGVNTGEVYVLLVTNYAGTVQTISVSDAATNTATTDCTIVPLSVEMTDFNGKYVENSVVLNWTTNSEKNNSHFIVERSKDGKVWSAIGIENGNGTTNNTQNYSFIDRQPTTGDNYYRLKQVDTDGKMDISEVINVSSYNKDKLKLHPNPSNEFVTVTSSHEISTVAIIDIRGKVIETVSTKGVYSLQVNLSEYQNGIYYVQAETENGTITERLVVQH